MISIRKLTFFVFIFINSSVFADDIVIDSNKSNTQNDFNFTYQANHDDWIKTPSDTSFFSVSKHQNQSFGEELALEWNLSDLISLNFNLFENQYTKNNEQNNSRNSNSNLSFGKVTQPFNPSPILDINRKISGYKVGISSQLGLGHDFKLGFNIDYGQLEGADLAGYNSNEINTTSFGLGIRKNKFGASLNTDVFLENSEHQNDSSRLGFKIDWFFDDNTSISIGSQEGINNTNTNTSTIDNITGTVQYIQFQHNL